MKFDVFSLGEIAKIRYGKNQKNVQSDNGDIPIYGTGGLMGYASRSLYNYPSVLIGRKGTINKVRYVDHPFWTVDTLFYTEVNEELVIPKYLYYLMSLLDLDSYNEGTTIPSLRTETLNRLEFGIPDLDYQEKVLSMLEPIDKKIKLNNEVNKNLEQQIQELYKEWFITNREANWQRIPLSDIIFFQEGPGIRNWQYVEDGVKFINIRCINNGLIDTSTANKISLEEASGKYSHFMLEPYDIVMSCSGTLGRYAIVLPQNLPLCLNTSVIRFRPKQYKDDYSFVYGYMTSKEFLNQQITMANGSAQVNFGPTHLKKIEIVEPPVETRKKFNDLVFPLIETQISLRAENTRLVEIRDTLLPCLMSGEIDVSEVEI